MTRVGSPVALAAARTRPNNVRPPRRRRDLSVPRRELEPPASRQISQRGAAASKLLVVLFANTLGSTDCRPELIILLKCLSLGLLLTTSALSATNVIDFNTNPTISGLYAWFGNVFDTNTPPAPAP